MSLAFLWAAGKQEQEHEQEPEPGFEPDAEEEIDLGLFDDTERFGVVKEIEFDDQVKHIKKAIKKPGKGKSPSTKKGPKTEEKEDKTKKKKPLEVKTVNAAPTLHTQDKLVKCNICFGNIKTGLNIITCSCGKHYHENCAKRVEVCPVCETNLKEPVDLIHEAEQGE